MNQTAPIAVLSVIGILLVVSHACASPCDGVDRSLADERRRVLAPVLAEHLRAPSVDIIQSFRSGTWTILHVDTHQADEIFLFYSGEPSANRYVTAWSGAATIQEEGHVKKWAIDNAAGIPSQLAGCFAWHVARERASRVAH